MRSGYLDAYRRLSREQIETLRERSPPTFAGVEQSEEMMEWLWSNFSACGADHPSWEAWPTTKDWSLHEVMLAGWGMPIGELFDLEALAEQCSKVGRWSFFLVSKPVYVSGDSVAVMGLVLIYCCVRCLEAWRVRRMLLRFSEEKS